MTGSSQSFTTDDLLLSVATDVDPERLNLDPYEAFLDGLCGDREFQKEAIKTVCRLMGGGQYESTRELAIENYKYNDHLADQYGSQEELLESLSFPDILSCSVDLATATGKSYVMYGVARILLAEGIVDRVLLLCPSLTIEAGLTSKFKALSGEARLRELIPASATVRNPDITNADVTTGPGDICIENIHATYEHVSSSVGDSFAGRGDSTLVLNDEAHHVFTPPSYSGDVRRWKEFLQNPDFGFSRIAGFSGTCYEGDFYFADVVYRYSLRQAMEDGRVKEVRYVAKDESASQTERFQKYLRLHQENANRHSDRKPLSIVVTATRDTAESLAAEFAEFLAEASGIDREAAEELVLVVTSKDKHKANVARLAYVDERDDPTEWIFSVSMLTEGWDVDNVFQIVPHEMRAFNSKLLIAQVLGRGLRVPVGLTRPAVWVFNHSRWSSQIAGLVDEVLEGRRLHSYPVGGGGHGSHHFSLHQMTYKTKETEQELELKNGDGQIQLFKRGSVRFENQPTELIRETVFVDAVGGNEYTQRTSVEYRAYTVEEVVLRLRGRLKSIDVEKGTTYAQDYTADTLRDVIAASLEEIEETRDLVSETNLQHCFRALGNIHREMAKTVRIEREAEQIEIVETTTMRQKSVALNGFRRDATVFYSSESADLSQDVDARALEELSSDDSDFPRRSVSLVDNKYLFRSPVNVVLTTHEPERGFVKRLFDTEIAELLDSWIKSPDTGFYEIRYSYRVGDHTKERRFNPDLFLRLADKTTVVAVELKSDGDDSKENRAKLRQARAHFDAVNEAQSEARYHITFISPKSYDAFFQALRDGAADKFVSDLDTRLLSD